MFTAHALPAQTDKMSNVKCQMKAAEKCMFLSGSFFVCEMSNVKCQKVILTNAKILI